MNSNKIYFSNFFMSRKTSIILHSILSGILVLGSPFVILGAAFGLAGLAMEFSRGNWLSGFGGLFFLCLFSYPVFVNIYGWVLISKKQPQTYKVFLYPLYGTIILFIFVVINFYVAGLYKQQ